MLVMTGFLILFGTVLFFLLEYSNPATMGEFSVTKKLMASLFQSVTTRTAGFAAVSQSALRPGSRLLGCLLMFIGGSPTGTAGGIKTTTAAMLVLTVISVLRGRKDTECFNRKIDETVVRSGITISLVTFFLLDVRSDGAYDLRTGTGFPESDVRGDFSDGNRRVDSRPDTVSVQGESCRADDPDVYRTDRTGDDGTLYLPEGQTERHISVLFRKKEL